MATRVTLRSKYLLDAGRAFNRAPVEVALAIASALVLSWALYTNSEGAEEFRFVIAAAICMLFAWSGTLVHRMGAASYNERWIRTGIGAAFGAAYLLLVPDLKPSAEGWRTMLLIFGAALLAFASPAWTPRDSDTASLRLRRINGRILLRTIGAGLYGLALFAGLALAVVAIDKLFELTLNGDVYGYLFIWIMAALVPWVIVGGLDDYVGPLEDQSDVARVVHRMTAFLVPPLIALYFIILYTYALRIAITHELPQNLVSPMVIAAGLLVAIGLILFDPAADATGGPRLLRYAPLVFLPLAPLGLWSLFARVGQYGWTEFRLLRVILLVLLFVLAAFGTFQILRRRAFSLRVIPLAAGIVLLLCAAGPWGVLPVARRDQQHRLAKALAAAGVNVQQAYADSTRRPVPSAMYGEIQSGATYLRYHFGEAALAAVLPRLPAKTLSNADVTGFYNLLPPTTNQPGPTLFGQFPTQTAVPIGDGVTVYRIDFPNQGAQNPSKAQFAHDTLTVVLGADTMRAALGNVIGQLRQAGRGDMRLAPDAAIAVVTDARGMPRGQLVVLEISVGQTKEGRKVQRLDGMVYVR